MIDVKQAVSLAKKYCLEVFERPGEVEEVDTESNSWLITLSFDEPIKANAVQQGMLGNWGLATTKKSYKLFRVDSEDGHVISAKIRQLN